VPTPALDTPGWLLVSTTFLASAVEAVEALTIVLAVGVTRSWRPALSGTAWGLATLAAIVLVLGPAIVTYVPFAVLRTGIGVFLLVFGLAWLRKAILRYSGRKALHDEAAIFAREVGALRAAAGPAAGRAAFATAYNAVLLEGLEVAVIVLTFGASSAAALRWAALGALAAVVVVAGAGVALRRPLARVPENLLKFVVGIMLTSFGTFWCGEGLGIVWWRDDWSLPVIILAYVVVAAGTIAAARRPAPAMRSAA
jgi:uncharacterized membrane protein